MSKTIEELAREIAEAAYNGGDFQNDDEMEQGIKDLAESFMLFYTEDIMRLPLSSRLTTEEKERIRTYHKLAHDGYWECNSANKAVVKVLESIFGSDFFKEVE